MTESSETDPGVGVAPARLTGVLVAIATGLAWGAAHPDPGLWWLVFLVVPGWLTAVHVVREERARVVFATGSLLGFVAFAVVLRWLANIPSGTIAWPLLSVILAMWIGLASVVVRRWTSSRWVVLVGPLVWTGTEVLRARWPLGGFGWGDLASAHTDSSWMLTSARVLGADGLTLLTALLGAAVWAVVRVGLSSRGQVPTAAGRALVPGAARAVAVVDDVRPLLLTAVGVGMLGTLITVGPPPVTGQVDVLVVQGYDGTVTGDEPRVVEIARAHAEVTIAAVEEGGRPDLTVWAESALDRDPTTEAGAALRPAVEAAAAAVGGDLIAGVTRIVDSESFLRRTVVFDEDGEVAGPIYDKQRPVPFGEYVPARPVLGRLPPLEQFVGRDMVAGDGPVTLDAGGVRIAPIICFETLFGALVRDAVAVDDAGLVVAGTNNTSYGRSVASEQHIAQSRLRAVETGRAVVHASITGSSAVLLPDGSILATAPLLEAATIRASVPVVSGRTPAMTVGEPLSLALGAAAIGLAVHAGAAAIRRRRTRAEGDAGG